MESENIFISSIFVLLIFNFIYLTINPTSLTNIALGTIIGLVATVTGIIIVSGIRILGVGLDSSSIKIFFGIGVLINMLFRINVGGIPLGLGLINNILDVFIESDFLGLGMFVATTMSIITLASGLIIITRS